MREQLIKYVELLFAGTTDTYEIKQEILQNTLDRYDDLIDQGKSPEAAYRLAISGIGDINEILSERTPTQPAAPEKQTMDNSKRKLLRSIAIALYILCPVPLYLEGGTIGLCGLLLIVAVATGIIVFTSKGKSEPSQSWQETAVQTPTPQQKLSKAVTGIIWVSGICVYLIVSFATGAWYITWLIFLILPASTGLANAIMDLKEAAKYEN